MLLRGNRLTAVFREITTKHKNGLCGKNVKLLYVKAGGTYDNHWAL